MYPAENLWWQTHHDARESDAKGRVGGGNQIWVSSGLEGAAENFWHSDFSPPLGPRNGCHFGFSLQTQSWTEMLALICLTRSGGGRGEGFRTRRSAVQCHGPALLQDTGGSTDLHYTRCEWNTDSGEWSRVISVLILFLSTREPLRLMCLSYQWGLTVVFMLVEPWTIDKTR